MLQQVIKKLAIRISSNKKLLIRSYDLNIELPLIITINYISKKIFISIFK
jgi:hypothetical protein